MDLIDTPLIKGDAVDLEATLGEDITNWKLRVEIYDDAGQCVRLATANTGGADSQVEITNASDGIFLIKIPSNATLNFCDKGYIEIQAETDDDPTKIITLAKDDFELVEKRITWTTP